MRTSRVSKETSKLLENLSTPSPPRRSTRHSLRQSNGKSALKDDSSAFSSSSSSSSLSDLQDIEDLLSPSPSQIKPDPSPAAAKTITKRRVSETLELQPSPSKKTRKARKPARQIKNSETGQVEIHAPSDWETIYDLVMTMRKEGTARNAAVDTMGCESLAEEHVDARTKRFHTLIALMLSSQTKDTTNAIAMNRLQRELPPADASSPPGLNLENILAVEPELLNQLIWVVGFHNNKTKYIKRTAEILRDQYGGEIPDTIEGLMSLPGVGPKMGYLCLSSAWGRHEGIGVDVHVHRITNLWGWHSTKNPEETRKALEGWLPKDKWHEINWLLVGFGQKVCLPVGRKCGECEVGLDGLCRSAERGKVVAGRRIREERFKIEADGGLEKIGGKTEVEEVVLGEVVVNAEADAAIKIEEGQVIEEKVTKTLPEGGGPVTEQHAGDLTKEEEKVAIENMVNAPGEFHKSPTRATRAAKRQRVR